MHNEELKYWLRNLIIVGREDDEGDGDEGQDDEGDDGGDDGEEGEGEGESDEGSDDGDHGDPGDDPEKLKAKLAAKEKALREERKLRRKAERDARRKSKQVNSEKKTEDDAEAQKRIQASEEKATRLAAGLLKREVDDAIKTAATKLNFIDPTDALLDDIRKEIDAEQDEDDPTNIDIDMDSVVDAVKELADKKPHLVGKGTQGEPSGGKFRKRNKGADDQLSKQTLAEHYPSLR